MCNRTRASLKALQLLGNSVRGLDHGSWKLAYNAICLPVLTYGCQLWFTGKQVTLVKKLQTVQNDAVKIITGTFRTTPREPLHQLLNILPMKLRLNMTLQTAAFRLYKAPKKSQLLIRVGGAWHTPSPDDLHREKPSWLNLPDVTNNARKYQKCYIMHTIGQLEILSLLTVTLSCFLVT
jgi:hypothetical protein